MPLLVDSTQFGQSDSDNAAGCVTVGLINNMPDAALETTERQFMDLVRAAAGKTTVRLLLYYIPEVPRADAVRRNMEGRYCDVAQMWDTRLDGLIVTGTEPKSKNLDDEPYWTALAQLIDWARANTASTIWSCLAAHAAVLRSDGIERRPFATKLSGVFDCTVASSHPMLRNMRLPVCAPHSRCNDLPEQALKSAGYRILTRSPSAGVDMFARQERSFHLFLQGHPEYEATTLLREYRRDVGRYLRGEREHYPEMPQAYFDAETTAALLGFRQRALAERGPELLARFPLGHVEARVRDSWRDCAMTIYENWFDYLRGRKAERRVPLGPMRRAWRDWPKQAAPLVAEEPAT